MISCLCVTHDRHEFMPWLEHQLLKQSVADAELIIVDSSPAPWDSTNARVTVLHTTAWPGISEKRTHALAMARGEFITWFDDDDWQNPRKLEAGLVLDGKPLDAVGARSAEMFSTVTGLCRHYESHHEPIIFNSGVYRKASVPKAFSEQHLTGEDTEWQERFFAKYPNFITLGEPLHAWMCHGKNITNRANAMFFEKPCTIPFDLWELAFLEKLKGAKR